MVTAFSFMAMTTKSESRSVAIVLRIQLRILRIQENNLSASVLPLLHEKWHHLMPMSSSFESELFRWTNHWKRQAKRRDFFRCSLTFGKKMLSELRVSLIHRRPRWIHNPTLPVASSVSSIETVHFRKMTTLASDGATSHAVLEQVLLWLLQT